MAQREGQKEENPPKSSPAEADQIMISLATDAEKEGIVPNVIIWPTNGAATEWPACLIPTSGMRMNDTIAMPSFRMSAPCIPTMECREHYVSWSCYVPHRTLVTTMTQVAPPA